MGDFVEIKPFISIPDSSLYLFLALLFLTFLVVGFAFFKIYKEKKISKIDKNIEHRFLNLNFKDSKKTAYFLTKHLPNLLQTPSQERAFKQLLHVVEKYKYKKDVPPFSKADKNRVLELLKSCHVHF